MRKLRQSVAAGPHPKESVDEFGERLFVAFEALMPRYDRLFTLLREPIKRGRPPTVQPRSRIKGRTPDRLAMRVANKALESGRPIPIVAREVFAEDLRARDPRRHEALMRTREQFEAQGYTPDPALCRAFKHRRFASEHCAVVLLIRNSRNHLKARR